MKFFLDERFHYSNQQKFCQHFDQIKNRAPLKILSILLSFFGKPHLSLIENYWTTSSCLVERFQHSNYRYLSKN